MTPPAVGAAVADWNGDERLSFSSRALREVPGPAVDAHISAKILGRIVAGDLVRGRRQGFSFGFIFALARYGAGRFPVHG